MQLKEHDILLGQLALARGLISFPELIRCIHAAAQRGDTLVDYLGHTDLLSTEALTALSDSLDTPSLHLQEELETGHTLVLGHVHGSSVHEELSEAELLPLQATLGAHALPSSIQTPTSLAPSFPLPMMTAQASSRYTIDRLLGKGGMGKVWLAHDHMLNREVALKALRLANPEHKTLFEQQLRLEAQITGMLEHPSIIPVYDLGTLDEHGLYYTMRVVREESLESRLKRMRDGEDETPTLSHLIGIVRTALLALQYAHDHGIIHRDLKPENILVGAYGEVFVIDWGVAKVTARNHNSSLQRFSPTQTRAGALIGTPHYMAPEQALGENERVDERTDIYAMGVILYEILTLDKVFDAGHVLALLLKITEEQPMPPSQRTAHRHIPSELEEICLKALQKKQDARYQSAQEMAHDLNMFLEGIKERERHQQLAQELLEQAARHRKAYQHEQRAYIEASTQLIDAQGSIPSWASIEEKEPFWHQEQEVEQMRLTMERHFGEALRYYGQALGYVPGHSIARRGMAELYWQRFLRAEQSGEEANAIYFEGLVRQYNDGQYNTLLAGLATLSVRSQRPDAIYKIYQYEKGLHRLRAMHQLTSPQPIVNHRLPHGSYLVTIEAPGAIALRVPLLLTRLGICSVDVELLDVNALSADMVVVTEGDFLSGNIQNQSREQCTRNAHRFAIMRYPVTCRQYVEFLNGLASQGHLDEAHKRCPRVKDDADSYFHHDTERGFFIPEEDGEGTAWDPEWPIVLVTYDDAEAYATWRTQEDECVYHIPTAEQFEKAARGVDGRIFVWGNDFDPSFCRMRESERGRPFPTPIHTYPLDCSPYGVMHLNGNVMEWSSTWDSEQAKTKIMRGGSYSSSSQGCRLDWPISSPCNFRYSSYGFRLAQALPGDGRK